MVNKRSVSSEDFINCHFVLHVFFVLFCTTLRKVTYLHQFIAKADQNAQNHTRNAIETRKDAQVLADKTIQCKVIGEGKRERERKKKKDKKTEINRQDRQLSSSN